MDIIKTSYKQKNVYTEQVLLSFVGDCYCDSADNGAMENFFGRLKVEMYYGEKFESVNAFIEALEEYIYYYNNERIISKLKMSPVKYRTQSQII